MVRTAMLALVALVLCALVGQGLCSTAWPPGNDQLPSDASALASIAKYRHKRHRWSTGDEDYHRHSKKEYKDYNEDDYKKEYTEYKPRKNYAYEYPASDDDEAAEPCTANIKGVTVSPQPINANCPGAPAPTASQRTCDVPLLCGPSSCGAGCNPACPEGYWERYAAEQVEAHYTNQPGVQMADDRHTTYWCVDARGEDPMLGTPGGDLGEMMAAAMAYVKIRNDGSVSKHELIEAVDEVFEAFVDNVITPERPMYFHTDDTRLRDMFVYLATQLEGAEPSIMPFVGPSGSAGKKWLEALQRPEFNGCGHIRLMMTPDQNPYYGVSLAHSSVADCQGVTAQDQCISAVTTSSRMVENFFKYWWFTQPGSEQRHKTEFHVEGILVGPLRGPAVTVVSNKPKGSCPHQAPLVRPNFGASQVFVYNADAVANWRSYAARKLGLVKPSQLEAFISTWNAIAGQQLGATLAFLAPANNVGIFTVDVPTSPAHSH